MSCSHIEGRRLRLATQKGLLEDVPSSEKTVGESEGVSVTVDLLKALASPSSKGTSVVSYVTQLDVEIFVKNLLPLPQYKSKKKNISKRVSGESTYFNFLEQKNVTY